MNLYYEQDNIKLYLGDCLAVLRELADNSVDSVITDPPYSINFMNKEWDNEIAFKPEVWRECLRVAKPGASLMAFGGTRTYHRLTCAIEDGGWEIRDCISYFNDGTQAERAFLDSLDEEQLAAYLELHYPSNQMAWVYGQGFAKGANVSKLLDAAKGAEREVIGHRPIAYPDSDCWGTPNKNDSGDAHKEGTYTPLGNIENGTRPVTAPASPLAKTFSGYGSALKPAFEPIVVAMKPLDGTYANNAEVWGVSGLNIDECRVTMQEGDEKGEGGRIKESLAKPAKIYGQYEKIFSQDNSKGRWPANIIHDSSPEVLAEFDKAGVRGAGAQPAKANKKDEFFKGNDHKNLDGIRYVYDSGSAARFFQSCPPDAAQINPCLTCQECVTEDEPEADQPPGRWPANVISDGSEEVDREFDKAGVRVSGAKKLIQTKNKADGVINDGSGFNTNKLRIHNSKTVLEASKGSASRYYQKCPPDSEPARFRYCPKAPKSERSTPGNNHPTQKPLSLIRYLCRLTKTPYGGIVLDPFVGSGTTLLAARAEGRPAIGIDLDEGYCRICVGRLEGGEGEGTALRQAQAGPPGRQLRLF